VASFVRKVPTASGARAVQIVHKRGRDVVGIEHIGSAHDDGQLALLLEIARQRLHPGQDSLDLGLAGGGVGVGARIVSTRSRLLWQVLTGGYAQLGFDALADEAFAAMVLARIIEPTSKADTIRVLEEIGVPCPSLRTLFRALQRAQERDYRGRLAGACLAHSVRSGGPAGFVMYDCTTLHFESEDEDALRRVGMSKEHRVDPQVQVGLLVDPGGFPLEVHLFEGNTAETTTLVPVLRQFQQRHGITDMVVVADAGMLSAANLNALEDAGFSFIVGSRLTKAPYDLAEHFERKGDYFTDGQILESARVMGTGKAARTRRIVYQWSFKRSKRDDRTINLMIAKAEKIASGQVPMRKARFLKVTGAVKDLDQATIARARQLAGLKGYVTNVSAQVMSGSAVIAAYHDLWHVEASFRMAKSDLKARPVFHHQREAIDAHITVVFAALAITRYLTDATGVSIKRLVRTLRPLHSVIIAVGGHEFTAETPPTPEATKILTKLPPLRGD
jgi:DDE family transposase